MVAADTALRLPGPCSLFPIRLCQGLLQVGEQVVGVLDAN